MYKNERIIIFEDRKEMRVHTGTAQVLSGNWRVYKQKD